MVWFSEIEKDKHKKEEPKKEAVPPEGTSVNEAESVYNALISSVKEINQRYLEKKELDIPQPHSLIENLVNNFSSYEDKIVFFAHSDYSKDTLFYHTVNVSILAIKIGRQLEYPPDKLVYLGVLALLHGIGCVEEQSQGLEEIEKQEFVQQFIQRDASIQKSFIREALSVIAVVDVYESLTHSRHYREKLAPYEVLKAIISAGEEVFSLKVVRKIIEVFSVYPLGSLVQLNSGEVGQVVRINPDFPLRPEIVILLDNQGNKLKEKKTVDLSHNFNLFVKAPSSKIGL